MVMRAGVGCSFRGGHVLHHSKPFACRVAAIFVNEPHVSQYANQSRCWIISQVASNPCSVAMSLKWLGGV